MSTATPLNKAMTAIKAGDMKTARKILLEVLDDDPENEDAWLLLTRTTKNRVEQHEYLEKVLTINPNNEPARKALSLLERKTHSKKSVSKTEMSQLQIAILAVLSIVACSVVAGIGVLTLILVQPSQPVSVVSAPSPAATITTAPTNTPEPTDTPTPLPTETPIPTALPTDTPSPTTTPTSLPFPTYQIASIDDISVASAVRFRVTTTTEFPISVEQINALCTRIVEDLKRQRPFNAVSVLIYDTRSLLSSGYSIAMCDYAPNGEWSDAINVQTGDYATHQFVYDYQSKVNDPQTALLDRPSEQEYNLCQQWEELNYALPPSDDPEATEAFIFEQIAVENGISSQMVEDANFKCLLWAHR